MSLSLREKERFYRSLGQLLRAGATYPKALDSLLKTVRGATRRFVSGLRKHADGRSVAESFASERSQVDAMELGTLGAAERSGQLERVCAQLADYFGALARARESMLQKAAYPIFLLHFGILVGGLPDALFGGGFDGYLRNTGGVLLILWGVAICLALLLPLLRDFGSASAAIDSLLRALPLFGPVRRAFSVARFCRTYGMQLGAGVNVIEALQVAGRASRSGLIRAAADRAVPAVRAGEQVGPLLAASRALPEDVSRGICVAEESGGLDTELERLTEEYQGIALNRLDVLAEWLPRLLYLGILIYVGWSIVSGYQRIYSEIGKALDLN